MRIHGNQMNNKIEVHRNKQKKEKKILFLRFPYPLKNDIHRDGKQTKILKLHFTPIYSVFEFKNKPKFRNKNSPEF